MNAQPDPNHGLEEFLDKTPLRHLLGLPEAELDQAMATAYQLYQAGRLAEAEIICRGLIAADHTYWWCYSLYAAVLRKQGRIRDAIEQLDRGLRYEPAQPKLLAMRAELLRFVALITEAQRQHRAQVTPSAARTPATAVARPEVL